MRELVPVVKCDRCDEPISIETKSSIVNLDLADEAPRRYVGENCPTCKDEFDEAVSQVLGEYLILEQVKLSKQRVPRGTGELANESQDKWTVEDLTCPIPECAGKRPSPTRSALGQHLKAKHDKSLADVGMAKSHSHSRAARSGKPRK